MNKIIFFFLFVLVLSSRLIFAADFASISISVVTPLLWSGANSKMFLVPKSGVRPGEVPAKCHPSPPETSGGEGRIATGLYT